jgi:hypothetical protein
MHRVLQELRHSNSTLSFVVTIIGFHVLRPVVFMPPFVQCPQGHRPLCWQRRIWNGIIESDIRRKFFSQLALQCPMDAMLIFFVVSKLLLQPSWT